MKFPIDEFKIQDGVKMLRQLPDYDEFRDFDLPNEGNLSTVSKRIHRWAPSRREGLNIIYLTCVYLRNYEKR